MDYISIIISPTQSQIIEFPTFKIKSNHQKQWRKKIIRYSRFCMAFAFKEGKYFVTASKNRIWKYYLIFWRASVLNEIKCRWLPKWNWFNWCLVYFQEEDCINDTRIIIILFRLQSFIYLQPMISCRKIKKLQDKINEHFLFDISSSLIIGLADK